MAKSVKIVDKLPAFKTHAKMVLGDALRETARDILLEAKHKAPFKKGGLRSKSDTRMINPLHQRIEFNIEYAAAQEAGRSGSKVFRNYTTPGTGAHFLENAGDKRTGLRVEGTFKKHARRSWI